MFREFLLWFGIGYVSSFPIILLWLRDGEKGLRLWHFTTAIIGGLLGYVTCFFMFFFSIEYFFMQSKTWQKIRNKRVL